MLFMAARRYENRYIPAQINTRKLMEENRQCKVIRRLKKNENQQN